MVVLCAAIAACGKGADPRSTSGGSATSTTPSASTAATGGGEGGAGGSRAGDGAGGAGGFLSDVLPSDPDCDETGNVDGTTAGLFNVGKQNAYVFGGFLGPGSNIIARMKFPNGTSTLLPVQGLVSAADLRAIAGTPLGDAIAVAATPLNPGKPVVWKYSSDWLVGPLPLVESPGVAQPIHALAFSPDGRWLAMLAELELDDAVALYVVAADGSTPTPIRVSHAPTDASRDVLRFAWAKTVDADHARIAFLADAELDEVVGVYTADVVVGGEPTALLDASEIAAGMGATPTSFGWDASDRVYFGSRHEGSMTPRVYRAHATGGAVEPVAVTEIKSGSGFAQVPSFALSPDGQRIAFAANAPTKSLFEVYVAPVDGAEPMRVSKVQKAPPTASTRGASSPAEPVWSPDGTRLAVLADWEVLPGDKDDALTAFVLPTDVPGGLRAIAPSGSALLDLQWVAFSRDSKRVYAVGELLQDERIDLYSAPAGGKGDVPPLLALAQASAGGTGGVRGVIDAP